MSCDGDADSDQRLDDEFEALAAIYGSDFRRITNGHRGCEISLPSGVSLVAVLPPGYPSRAAAELTVRGGASLFKREHLRALSLELRQLSADAAHGDAKGEGEGEECLWQAAQVVSDRLDCMTASISDVHAAHAAESGNSSELEGQRVLQAQGEETADVAAATAVAAADEELCIVLIDHMNNGRAYSKKIAAWAQQLGITGRQLSRVAAQKRAPKATATNGDGGGRLEGVIVLLLGDSSAISGWLTRLRTQYVDVNVKGLNCKERKSTVLSRGPPPPPPGGGWRQMLAAEGEGTEKDGGARHWVQQRYVSSSSRGSGLIPTARQRVVSLRCSARSCAVPTRARPARDFHEQ